MDSNSYTSHEASIYPNIGQEGSNFSTISTISSLGEKIKDILLRSSNSIKCKGLSRGSDRNITRVRNFNRVSYEFDVDPLSFAELPVLISKSEQDSSDSSRSFYILPQPMLNKIVYGLSKDRGTSKDNANANAKDHAKPIQSSGMLNGLGSAKCKSSVVDDDDIYGGIVDEKVGKYVPVGSLETTQPSSIPSIIGIRNPPSSSTSNIKLPPPSSLSAVTLQSKAMMMDVLSDEEDEKGHYKHFKDNQHSSLSPISSLSSSLKQQQSTSFTNRSSSHQHASKLKQILEVAVDSNTLDHHAFGSKASTSNIFSGYGKNIPEHGQAMGHGSYDDYSNTSYYEDVNSGDEEEDTKAPRKRPKKK